MNKKRIGLTLVEVMVAAAVFGFAVLGVFGMGRMMHRTAIDNVSDGVATQVVEGIMEQIRAQPYQTTLVPASKDTSGATRITFHRYQSAKSSGAAGTLTSQDIPINSSAANAGSYSYADINAVAKTGTIDATGFVTVDGVNLAVKLDNNYAITSDVPMDLAVRIVMTPVNDANFANGVTVELFYRYRAGPTDGYTNRVIRTFISKAIL